MTEWKAYPPFIYRDKRTYHWRTDGARLELLAGRRVVAKVVSDLTYLGMWRIDLGDGVLSDMVNLSRAKDVAVRLADASQVAGKTPASASPMRLEGRAGISQPGMPACAPQPANPLPAAEGV